MTDSNRSKNLTSLIRRLSKSSRIVRFITALVQNARVEKPPARPYSGGDDPILIRHFDSDNVKPAHSQIPKESNGDSFDTDRKIFDPLPDPEIDFSKENDLEAYTQKLNVPQEVIERWVAAGILRPDEIKVAEKILKIMREKSSSRKKRDSNSTY